MSTQTTAEKLRGLIHDSEKTINAIAVEAGISAPVLFRFVNGESGLTHRTADKLFAYFNLELRKRKHAKA